MADKKQKKAKAKAAGTSATVEEPTPPVEQPEPDPVPAASSASEPNHPEEAGEARTDALKQQRTSLILRAVLEEEPPQVVTAADGRKLRYPWYADLFLGLGLLVAVAGFTIGLFKMYITHKAQQCIMETDYAAAIALLKGNPLPELFSINGTDRNEDPNELLARALYLDAMHKLDDQSDVKGGLAELAQIRAGTHYFEEAQKILADNFTPSELQLTGGVVQNNAVNRK